MALQRLRASVLLESDLSWTEWAQLNRSLWRRTVALSAALAPLGVAAAQSASPSAGPRSSRRSSASALWRALHRSNLGGLMDERAEAAPAEIGGSEAQDKLSADEAVALVERQYLRAARETCVAGASAPSHQSPASPRRRRAPALPGTNPAQAISSATSARVCANCSARLPRTPPPCARARRLRELRWLRRHGRPRRRPPRGCRRSCAGAVPTHARGPAARRWRPAPSPFSAKSAGVWPGGPLARGDVRTRP